MTKDLHRRVGWQKTPEEVYLDDLAFFVLDGIRDLYIITGRASALTDESILYEEEVPRFFVESIGADEREYALVVAEISFFRKVQTDVNNHVGYTTDALSVTHADKPYRYLSETIEKLETKRRSIWHKMYRFNM